MTTRWTLLAESVADLADRCGVTLPATFRPPADLAARPAAQAALVAAHAVDNSGEPTPELRAGLAALAAPDFTVEITLAPIHAGAAAPADQPARAWTAVLAVAGEVLTVLLRRDVVPLVEVGVTTAADLPRELHRLLDTLTDPPARHREVREIVVPSDLIPLLTQARGADHDTVARVEGTDVEQVDAAARLIDTAESTLELRVVGAGAQPLVGQVLWYATAAGWIALEPAPEQPSVRMLRLQPVVVADAVPSLAPLIDAVLPTAAGQR